MLKKSLLLLSFSTLMFSNTTMCFKQNWTNPATIETTKLDGGNCLNKYSIKDMKKNGWTIKDIKINTSVNSSGMDYMYILTKNNINTKDVVYIKDEVSKDLVYENHNIQKSSQITKANYIAFKQYEDEAKKEKEKKKKKEMIKQANTLYVRDCQSCHGVKAEVEAYNSSRALKTLTKKEFSTALWEYYMDEKDNGFAILMKPIAESLSKENINSIYDYIQSIK